MTWLVAGVAAVGMLVLGARALLELLRPLGHLEEKQVARRLRRRIDLVSAEERRRKHADRGRPYKLP